MLFGKRRRSAATRQSGPTSGWSQSELHVVAYDKMLKGNKLSRKGKPIRQAAVVVHGTVKLITSGESVDRLTYEALIKAGIVAPEDGIAPPDRLEASDLPEGDSSQA